MPYTNIEGLPDEVRDQLDEMVQKSQLRVSIKAVSDDQYEHS